jgi:hypothetical protein
MERLSEGLGSLLVTKSSQRLKVAWANAGVCVVTAVCPTPEVTKTDVEHEASGTKSLSCGDGTDQGPVLIDVRAIGH